MTNEEAIRDIEKIIRTKFSPASVPLSLRIAIEALKRDSVSTGTMEQIRWERNVAMKQLEEHGIPFGGTADDVVKVVRCKDCKLWQTCNLCMRYGDDWFCKGGERRTE